MGGRPGLVVFALFVGGLFLAAALTRDPSPAGGAAFFLVNGVVLFAVTWVVSGRFVLTIDASGVTDRRAIRTVRVPAAEIVALSWDGGYWFGPGPWRFGTTLVVLRRGDPYPRQLRAGVCSTRNDAHRLLTEIAAHGWPVDDRPTAATTWWYLDPRAAESNK